MIPLMVIALGLGAALAVYELSPGARASFEAYRRAIRAANTTPRTADAQLQTAHAVAPGDAAVDLAIAATLASLGVGQCGVRSYAHVTARVKDALLARLRSEGMGVTGDNPWNIDTAQYDVKLRAVWVPANQTVTLIVTAGQGGYFGLVTCAEIWKKIDPIMKAVIGG